MRLSLLRSPISPDALADKGHHSFLYSLFPHQGDWREGYVAQAAYELNVPLRASLVSAQPNGNLPPSYSFAELADESLIIETLKKAENGDGWIVRIYEHLGSRHENVTICFAQAIRKAIECNLIEEGETAVTFESERLQFAIAPYEIKTFRLWF
jgi:alpha-mannosidase